MFDNRSNLGFGYNYGNHFGCQGLIGKIIMKKLSYKKL